MLPKIKVDKFHGKIDENSAAAHKQKKTHKKIWQRKKIKLKKNL